MTAQGFDRAAALPGFRVMARPSPGVVMSRSGVGRRVGRQVFLPVAVLLLAGLALIGAGATRVWTEATFASATSAGGNTFGTGTWAAAPCYTPAITADSPWLWYRLGEASGTVANDSSARASAGTYRAGVSVPNAGAFTCGTDTSALFAGPTGHVSSSVTGADAWSGVAPLPAARYFGAAATDASGRIYNIGGVDSAGAPTARVDRFDPAAGTWTTVAPLSIPRAYLAAAVDASGRIYAIGGDILGYPSGQVERFDPATGTWTTLAQMSTDRGGMAAATDTSGRIYAIGGVGGGGAPGQVDRYDPATNTWATLAPLSTAKSFLAAATDASGRIYAIGGQVAGSAVATVQRFDPAAGTWATLAPLSTARSYLAAAADASGRIYAIGGQVAGSAVATVQRFDPAAGTWATLAPLSTARSYLAAAADASGRIYAIGGQVAGSAVATVQRFDPAPKWTGSFSEEVWFKTSSTAGGRLMGFGDAQTGTSAKTDRNLYMSTTGKVLFGVATGTNAKTSITSPLSYNDGLWHLATATMNPSTGKGMTLYVDGQVVASNTTTLVSFIAAGYWRVGHDTLAGWASAPATYFFSGQMQDAAVYAKTLTPAQVLSHYDARTPKPISPA
ncbi:kelch repeat-containing protein [Tessaracoccus sp.]